MFTVYFTKFGASEGFSELREKSIFVKQQHDIYSNAVEMLLIVKGFYLVTSGIPIILFMKVVKYLTVVSVSLLSNIGTSHEDNHSV